MLWRLELCICYTVCHANFSVSSRLQPHLSHYRLMLLYIWVSVGCMANSGQQVSPANPSLPLLKRQRFNKIQNNIKRKKPSRVNKDLSCRDKRNKIVPNRRHRRRYAFAKHRHQFSVVPPGRIKRTGIKEHNEKLELKDFFLIILPLLSACLLTQFVPINIIIF